MDVLFPILMAEVFLLESSFPDICCNVRKANPMVSYGPHRSFHGFDGLDLARFGSLFKWFSILGPAGMS